MTSEAEVMMFECKLCGLSKGVDVTWSWTWIFEIIYRYNVLKYSVNDQVKMNPVQEGCSGVAVRLIQGLVKGFGNTRVAAENPGRASQRMAPSRCDGTTSENKS